MSAEALFAAGGVKVLDRPSYEEGSTTLGYVWVEPGGGGGQTQYWVLGKLLGLAKGQSTSYVFEHWAGAPAGVAAWRQAVDDLWPEGGGYYVVAQSSVVTPLGLQASGGTRFSAPAPSYPRREVAARLQARTRRTGAGAGGNLPPGPGELAAEKKPAGQIIVPLAEMRQSNIQDIFTSVGVCGGWVEAHEELTYFTGQELFLLEPEYVSAGEGITRTRLTVKEDLEINTFAELRHHIEEKWHEGCRYEVTWCDYYRGEQPPPGEFR